MKVIIYGRDPCLDCSRSRMLCQIRSLDFQYHEIDRDITTESLHDKIGHAVTSLPQIFLQYDDHTRHVGGYEGLRSALS